MPVSNPALVGLRVNNRPFSAVINDVNQMIERSGLMPDCDFYCSSFPGEGSRLWPTDNKEVSARWVACFPVRGGSEGFWVHIHPMLQNRNTGHIEAPIAATMKVWSWEDATKLAAIAAEIFDWSNLAD